jgi:hypothetical protein
LNFVRFVRFNDVILVVGHCLQLKYKNASLLEKPLCAETINLKQEWSQAFPVDGDDFSLFLGKRFPASLNPN